VGQRTRSIRQPDGRRSARRYQGNPAVAKRRFETARTHEAIEDLKSHDAAPLLAGVLGGCRPDCEECRHLSEESRWPHYQLFQQIDHWVHRRPDILLSPPPDGRVRPTIPAPSIDKAQNPRQLERQLVAHVKMLLSSEPDGVTLWRVIEPALARAAQVPGAFAFYARDRELARAICLFAPFWARTPSSWDPESGTPLLYHVFAAHHVPAWLIQCSREAAIEWDLKPLAWISVFGRGASLRRVARELGWNVSAGLVRELTQEMAPESFMENCFLAELRRRGCPDRVAADLALTPLLRRDPTEAWPAATAQMFAQAIDEPTWNATIDWFTRFGEELRTSRRRRRVLRWFEHELTEAAMGRRGPFSWKGRRPASTYELARQFRKRSLARHNIEWRARGWDYAFSEDAYRWTFRELVTSRELVREGAQMGHCVGLYQAHCVAGESAIFSMTCGNEPRLTIEMRPDTGTVVQARGRFNRPATESEQRAIATWREEIVAPKLRIST
jgi:hypothetical protein